jgi:hypothetical protein
LPTVPVEVVRLRVARARDLGLSDRTCAGVRAASGHDVVAILFSSNALRLLPPAPVLPPDRAARLASIAGAGRIALVHRPLAPAEALAAAPAFSMPPMPPRAPSPAGARSRRPCVRLPARRRRTAAF